MKAKICHITTAHSSMDIRIFKKECISLKNNGYDVHLIAPDEKDKNIDGIYIHSLPRIKNRKERIFKLRNLALKKALQINADLYHFHDPELISLGLKLKKFGKKVIYDVHEDVPRDIMTKDYIPFLIRPFISKSFEIYENWASKKFDYIFTATPYIKERFKKINKNCIDINNYPLKEEFNIEIIWEKKKSEICYIGNITRIRGIVELIKSLEYTNTTLHLVGNFENENLKKEVMSLPSWKKVKYYGFLSRENLKKIISVVKIGIINFLPVPNHINAQPNKMFEYMSAGIAVIASNFPLWKEIIEKNNCGICVNPRNPKEIANAINYLLENDELSKQMGKNGRTLVKTKFNWEKESEKLINVYNQLLNKV